MIGNVRSVALADVAELNPRLADTIQSTTQVSFVPMAAITEVTGEIVREEIRPYAEVAKGFTPFKSDDVIVAKITPCFQNGKIAHAKLSQTCGFGSTEFHVVRADTKQLFPRYLFHFLRQDYIRVAGERRMTGSAGQRRVPQNYLAHLEIPLPPLAEQKRIAEILDRAEALRAKRRAALALLDELTQSIFLDMFGDPVSAPGTDTVTLEDVADLITGFAFKSSEFVQSGDSVRLCRGANVLPRTLDWSDVVFWPNDRVAEVDKFLLTPGDVIIAMDRPWISSGFKIAQVTAEDCPALLVQRVARLRGRTVTNNFLYELLKQPAFTRHCKPTETTVPHISPTDLRTFAFSMPSSEALRRFDARLATIAKIRSSVIESEVLSDQLFASLQHRAFRGEL